MGIKQLFVLFKKGVLTLFAALTLFCVGCDEQDLNKPRPEFIDLYMSLEELHSGKAMPKTSFFVPSTGGMTTVYVKSNVDFSVQWQNSTSVPWGKIMDSHEVEDGVYAITIKTLPRSRTSAYYSKRTATMMLTAKELDFGSYINVYQGLTARLGTDFSWLQYGTGNPMAMDGQLISGWKSVELDNGYESTIYKGEEQAYLYGKNGFVQLGDDKGHGADIITPFAVSEIRNDSLLILTFNAVAFNDNNGIKDNNKLKVEVLDGGTIRDYADDGGTSIDFEVPYFDANADDISSSMWNGTEYLVGIASTKSNPVTIDTRIRISTGDNLEGNSRIFIDNIYLRRIYCKDGIPVDEDLYLLNGGSGRDVILGARGDFSDDVWILN